jgi:hypothetical protein
MNYLPHCSQNAHFILYHQTTNTTTKLVQLFFLARLELCVLSKSSEKAIEGWRDLIPCWITDHHISQYFYFSLFLYVKYVHNAVPGESG